MNDNYVKDYYKVPNDVGRKVTYRERTGVIYEIRGQYVNVNFDDDKPARVSVIHPHDPELKFGDMGGVIRKLTRSQQRYHEWRMSDGCESFTEFIKYKMYRK